MALNRVIGRTLGRSDLNSYECRDCHLAFMETATLWTIPTRILQ
jgi:hypothetical protein